MKYKIFIYAIFAMLVAYSCGPKKNLAGYYTYESECLGVELDGSETIRSWGTGRNRKDAVEQARKNAVRDVLFKGISKGKSDCDQRPVLVDMNAYEKHRNYFNGFFTDDGPYTQFTSTDDGSRIKGKSRTKDQVTYGVTVRVLRSQLRERMIQDNIIK